jgi:hypothetical protein
VTSRGEGAQALWSLDEETGPGVPADLADDGIYRQSTKCIDIISGPGAGCVGLKPSPATAEVIKAVNPKPGSTGEVPSLPGI